MDEAGTQNFFSATMRFINSGSESLSRVMHAVRLALLLIAPFCLTTATELLQYKGGMTWGYPVDNWISWSVTVLGAAACSGFISYQARKSPVMVMITVTMLFPILCALQLLLRLELGVALGSDLP